MRFRIRIKIIFRQKNYNSFPSELHNPIYNNKKMQNVWIKSRRHKIQIISDEGIEIGQQPSTQHIHDAIFTTRAKDQSKIETTHINRY